MSKRLDPAAIHVFDNDVPGATQLGRACDRLTAVQARYYSECSATGNGTYCVDAQQEYPNRVGPTHLRAQRNLPICCRHIDQRIET
jgi:hypothetical protein